MQTLTGPEGVDILDPVADHPLNAGLVSWYLPLPHLTGGRRLWDLCNRNHGALTNHPTDGTAWQGGPNGFGAVNFDGSNDYVTAAIASLPRPYTVLAAYNVSRTYTAGGNILWSHDSGANDGARLQLGYIGDKDQLTLTFGGVAEYPLGAGLTTVTNVWSFCAATVPANSGTASAWLASNGALTAGTAAVGSMSGTPSRLTLSSPLFGDAVHIAGRVGFLAVLSGAASEATIRGWHKQWLNGFPDTLRRRRAVVRVAAAAPAGNRRRRVIICGSR